MIVAAAAGILTVSSAGGFATVGAAVTAARAGDTVLVEAGRYQEVGPVVVNKRLVILGRGAPVVAGRGDHSVFVVTASGVEIAGLVVEHVEPSSVEDRAGIRIEEGTACRIHDNEIRDTFFGIFGAKADRCVVARNRVVGRTGSEHIGGNAIQFWSSREVVIEGNVVTGHRDGIYLEFVTVGRIVGNESRSNLRYGLHFMFSDSSAYRDNRFEANGAGVAVMYSKGIEMSRNRFRNHRGPASYGLLLKDITDGRVADNEFADNTTGLYLEGTNRIEFTDNRLTGNGWALRLLANSIDNDFRGNVFEANAFDVATNSRSTGSRFAGNYWDRYRGFDLDRDGRGDIPFRPVRLFSLVVEQNRPALILLRSVFVDLLDLAERVLPVLTPAELADPAPLMEAPQ
ncbi:MAG: nitrous oxide reductase family maturation protein NosD [Gemmatimonadales bacterium]